VTRDQRARFGRYAPGSRVRNRVACTRVSGARSRLPRDPGSGSRRERPPQASPLVAPLQNPPKNLRYQFFPRGSLSSLGCVSRARDSALRAGGRERKVLLVATPVPPSSTNRTRGTESLRQGTLRTLAAVEACRPCGARLVFPRGWRPRTPRLDFAAAAPLFGLDPGPGVAGWVTPPRTSSRGSPTGGRHGHRHRRPHSRPARRAPRTGTQRPKRRCRGWDAPADGVGALVDEIRQVEGDEAAQHGGHLRLPCGWTPGGPRVRLMGALLPVPAPRPRRETQDVDDAVGPGHHSRPLQRVRGHAATRPVSAVLAWRRLAGTLIHRAATRGSTGEAATSTPEPAARRRGGPAAPCGVGTPPVPSRPTGPRSAPRPNPRPGSARGAIDTGSRRLHRRRRRSRPGPATTRCTSPASNARPARLWSRPASVSASCSSPVRVWRVGPTPTAGGRPTTAASYRATPSTRRRGSHSSPRCPTSGVAVAASSQSPSLDRTALRGPGPPLAWGGEGETLEPAPMGNQRCPTEPIIAL
jgi:hypothetical protein